MSENTMPAAEAAVVDERELASYELAFHVLPTVAEGEVTGVVDALKKHIAKAGGELFGEEAPQRFDLAYEVIKHLEGKNRGFKSAYFGWLRFRLEPQAIDRLSAEVEDEKSLLRYLLIRLTKVEEEHPFYFHDALVKEQVSTVDIETDASSDDDDTDEIDTADTDSVDNDDDADEELDEDTKKDEA